MDKEKWGCVSLHFPIEQSSIMIDFISATKCLYKDTPNLSNCKWISTNTSGWERFELMGQKAMKVLWKPSDGLLKIEGSIPYFVQGHNFSFDKSGYIDGINLLQCLLDVGLWDAWLNEFEHGVIFPVDGKPVDYIKYHSALKHSRLRECINGNDKGNGKWWEGSAFDVKMYNPKANFQHKVGYKQRRDIEGYNPDMEYLKFEAHYNKPHLLNAGRDLLVEDLQCPDCLSNLHTLLLSKYQLLHPMKTLIKPTDKGQLKYQELVTMKLVEVLMNQGMTISEAQREVYRFMDEFDCLTKPDKDKRKATARSVFGRLQESEKSQWDLTEKIEEALVNDV